LIDTTKTVGTAETFDPEKIRALLSQGVINNVGNLEKAILSLEYLGQLPEEGVDLIFKGLFCDSSDSAGQMDETQRRR
jgi:hypothetical protein